MRMEIAFRHSDVIGSIEAAKAGAIKCCTQLQIQRLDYGNIVFVVVNLVDIAIYLVTVASSSTHFFSDSKKAFLIDYTYTQPTTALLNYHSSIKTLF